MADYLVRLYALPSAAEAAAAIEKSGGVLRRALVPEKSLVVDWVRTNFSRNWADECEVAFSRQPVSCWIVTRGQEILGFACHDCIFRGFFGPTGTATAARGQGVGRALLLASLHAMAEAGYAYAVIGSGDGAAAFYQKTVGATVIADSAPGPYRHLLFPLDAPAAKERPGAS